MLKAELDEAGAHLREMRRLVASAYKAVLMDGGRGEDIGEIMAAAHGVAGSDARGEKVAATATASKSKALDALKVASQELDRLAVLHKVATDALHEADAKRRQSAPGYRV